MSDEDELEKWRKERGIPEEEMQRLFSPELRMLRLFEKLTERVATNKEEARQREERIKRNIEFVASHQAQFSIDMDRLREIQERSEKKWERTEGEIRNLLAIAEIHEGEIEALKEVQEQASRERKEAQAQLDKQMAETDERIGALVNAVEALVSQRHNGGGAGEG